MTTFPKTAWLALLAAGLAFSAKTRAATSYYDEKNGQVVVEAEHFTTRVDNTDGDVPHHWHIFPDEDGKDQYSDSATFPFTNMRNNALIQVIPDSAGGGENKNTGPEVVGTEPYVEYEVLINSPGTYRLWLRWGGYDGSSDSMYAQVREAIGHPEIGPDWYRYARNANPNALASLDFSAVGWDGSGAPSTDAANRVGGGGGEVPAIFNLGIGIYTIRLSQREDGAAVDAVMLQKTSLADPTAPGPAESSKTDTFISVTQPPQDKTATPGTTATFTVTATGSGPITYQWQSKAPGAAGFSDVGGATSASYTTPTTTEAMNGTLYQVALTSGTKTVTTLPATLITDATTPSLVLAVGSPDYTHVTVYFSEKVDQATAETAGNYTINGVNVTGASLDSTGKIVTLTTASQTASTPYTLTVKNVKDLAGNAITSATTDFQGASFFNGAIKVDLWNNILNADVASLENDPRYPDSPDRTLFWNIFGPFSSGNNYGDNYGGRVSGWIAPPVSGQYKFYLRSDDASRLSLSTDETPGALVQIAEETTCCHAFGDPAFPELTSSAITLEQGKRYYILALWKEGGGDDYVQVGWRTPNDPDLDTPPTGPIPGQYLSTLADPTGVVTITQQPQSVTVAGGTAASFSIAATGLSSFGTNILIQWQKAPAGSSTFTDIPGATGPTYNIAFANVADTGAQYRAVVTAGGKSVNSDAATLTVSADTTLPTVTSVGGTTANVLIAFSEAMDQASAETAGNYQISGGVKVDSARLVSAPGQAGVVSLAISGATVGSNYALTISGVKDIAGNPVASTTQSFTAYSIFANFNGGIPPGATIAGSASILGTGVLQLTPNIGNLQGGVVFEDVLAGAEVTKFTVKFKLFIGNGTPNAADGFSFNLAPNLSPGSTFSEDGTGSGLTVAFDTYDNAGGEAPAVDVKWAGTEIATTKVAKTALVNNRWVDVVIQGSLDANGVGHVTVLHDNVKYYDNLEIPDWTTGGLMGPLIGMGARTGGENEAHQVDDLAVVYNADVALPHPPTITITAPANNTDINAGGSATVTVEASDPENQITKVEFFANGSKLGEDTSGPYSFTIPAVPPGYYSVTANVTDAEGLTVISSPVLVNAHRADADKVLFIHATGGPNPADIAAMNHLYALGYDVINMGANPSQTSDADGKKLIVVSSTVSSGEVADKFQTVAVPVLNWENALQDNFLFTTDDATDHGTTGGQQTLEIVDPSNPLSAGLSGTVTVTTAPIDFSWGMPPDSAIKVAKLTDGTGHFGIYAFEKGAALTDRDGNSPTAAERRAHIFFTDTTALIATPDGIKLFDALVNWLTHKDVVVERPHLTISANGQNLTINWTGGGTLESADKVDGPYTPTGDSDGSFTTTAAGTAKFFRVQK